jgi:hypothetical protein
MSPTHLLLRTILLFFPSLPHHPHSNLRLVHERLQHHAVPFRQLPQRLHLALRHGTALPPPKHNLKPHPYPRYPNRRAPVHAHGPLEILIALRRHRPRRDGDAERRRHGFERDARAGDQRVEQHVAGAQLAGYARVIAAGFGVKAGGARGFFDGGAGGELAGYGRGVEGAGGFERYEGRRGVAAVGGLDGRLLCAEGLGGGGHGGGGGWCVVED